MSFTGYKFNIVKHRGNPNEAILQSGHVVRRQDYVYYQNADYLWRVVKCADYHGEHFLYVDPLFLDGVIGHWSFLCTCGSAAVIVGPEEADFEDSNCPEQLLVCYVYHATLKQHGVGMHANQVGRRRWT